MHMHRDRRRRTVSGQLTLTVALGSLLLALASPQGVADASAVGPVPRSVWLYEPDAAALPGLNAWVDEVLDNIEPATRLLLADAEIRVHVIPRGWHLTDLPLWSNLRGLRLPDPDPADSYQEQRSFDELRALGPGRCVSGPLDLAVAEEQIVAVPYSSYPVPRLGDLGKNLVHELGHAVECGLAPAQTKALADSYAAAGRRPVTEVAGDLPSYSISTRQEYFAEGVVAWFEAAQGPSYRRAWLIEHDPMLHDLLAQVFEVPPPLRLCNGQRATTVLATPSEYTGTPGDDIIVGSPGDDVINGAGGDDVVCGEEGDDTIFGGYGSDQLFGGLGDDTYVGGSGDDVLSENTPMVMSGGADNLNGGPGSDKLDGGSGNDTLVDSSGRDELVGGADDDILDGRDEIARQPDALDGSEGADRCEHDPDDKVLGCHPPEPPPTTQPHKAEPTTTTQPSSAQVPPSTSLETTPAEQAPV
jgi:hypothetical protein